MSVVRNQVKSKSIWLEEHELGYGPVRKEAPPAPVDLGGQGFEASSQASESGSWAFLSDVRGRAESALSQHPVMLVFGSILTGYLVGRSLRR